MKTLIFRGYSDDTFGEFNVFNEAQDNCANMKSITFVVMAQGKTLYVTGQYGRYGNGTWGIDVAPADEDELPDWQIELSFKEYSTILTIIAPDDVMMDWIKR